MPTHEDTPEAHWMQIALQEAAKGQGLVEPNPMVGCVLVRDGKELARGFHRKLGTEHAEVVALNNCREKHIDPTGATAYVNLEPCCHFGKTPPCADALIEAKVSRVVIADGDPFPQVSGGGLEKLRQAGIDVEVGILCEEAQQLNAPYLKLQTSGIPWMIAKWAMTLDGKIATVTGDSQWISNSKSREVVHELRARVDAVMVGSGTVLADDPLLTTRLPDGQLPMRLATRVVVDSNLQTPIGSKLVNSANESPVWLATSQSCEDGKVAEYKNKGCHVLSLPGDDHAWRLDALLKEMGESKMTNVLVEGGGGLLGNLLSLKQIDEVHVFIGNKIVGGSKAKSPVAGFGIENLSDALQLEHSTVRTLDGDLYLSGRVKRPSN